MLSRQQVVRGPRPQVEEFEVAAGAMRSGVEQ
jgi:hypothetical protein